MDFLDGGAALAALGWRGLRYPCNMRRPSKPYAAKTGAATKLPAAAAMPRASIALRNRRGRGRWHGPASLLGGARLGEVVDLAQRCELMRFIRQLAHEIVAECIDAEVVIDREVRNRNTLVHRREGRGPLRGSGTMRLRMALSPILAGCQARIELSGMMPST